jgi:trimeric autotransporter adhesin
VTWPDENSSVTALAVFDDGSGPALYAGGAFTAAGGVTVNGIARWDGAAWSALSGPFETGVIGTVMALAAGNAGSGPALHVGGGPLPRRGTGRRQNRDVVEWLGHHLAR